MGKFIPESTFINNNITRFEDRLNSQYSRVLESKPMYSTYYHISNNETSVDIGFKDTERILGKNSSVRFHEIKNFPIYGITEMQLSLDSEDEGLNTNYDGDGIILQNTIKPLPGDVFLLTHMTTKAIFMVTTVEYDTIKSNNYYKIGYTILSIEDTEYLLDIERQTVERYTCNIKNIGTDEKAIIRDDIYEIINEMVALREDIIAKYKMLFYNRKFNSFMMPIDNVWVYDRCLNNFIQTNQIMNSKEDYETIHLSNEDNDNTFLFEYELSFFRAVEKNNKVAVKPEYKYMLYKSVDPTSIFGYYREPVRTIRLSGGTETYIRESIITGIQTGILTEEPLYDIIIKYFNKSITSPFELRLEEIKNYPFVTPTMEAFIYVPIVLFILEEWKKMFISNE